ncbi:hypothetical protein PSTG_14844 [Puccinia striiformis f. sp. tritici PST-78]|uniref:Uncharacterized protein n=1 Tax=Puccinia striiformis f. sp. tritici PST-78 TaxID=1165861 RepID=A0A0L0UXS8_9BASI|nr:hypothetical protein PSTG_14844 [Puccinia striiformis f. sp. tritici PST-78]
MLLTKTLVALQILHYHGVSGNPLALLKPLVKRAEHIFPPVVGRLQNLDEHIGELQSGLEKQRSTLLTPEGVPGTTAIHPGTSDIHASCDQHNFAPSELSEDPIFGEDDVSVIGHLDHYESKMLQNIVKKSDQNNPSGNPFAQMNTLRAILDDSKKDEVLKLVQKYLTVPQTSTSNLEKSQETDSHSSADILTDENTAMSLQDRISTIQPAHLKKEELCAECQELMGKFDGTKKERLSKILIDDFIVIPPFTAQFLQDYYLKLIDFLSMLNDTEKDTFWGFRKTYKKLSGMTTTDSLTQDQATQSGRNFVNEECGSEEEMDALISMGEKLRSSPEAGNNPRANYRRSMIFLSNLDEAEVDICFRMSEYMLNNLKNDKQINHQ